MVMSKARRDELRRELRERGVRATPARLAVLKLLRGMGKPLSYAEVVRELADESADPATLYRNLMDLDRVGLVRRRDMGDHTWRFEAVSADHDAAAHPHFVCTDCGAVECLPVIELPLTRGKIPRAVRTRQVEIQLRGVCDACA
jgi:Fur family transcriptional regulator, ferric uptake regulator